MVTNKKKKSVENRRCKLAECYQCQPPAGTGKHRDKFHTKLWSWFCDPYEAHLSLTDKL